MISYFTRIILCVLFMTSIFNVSFAQTDWTKYPGNPVMAKGETGSWDDKNLSFACVLLVDGTYHMWYDGNWDNQGNTNNGIGHATSLDGIQWTKDILNPVLTKGPEVWESLCITQASVLFVDSDSLFHMWYAGWGDGPGHIGHATSPDGTHWTKDLNNPVLSAGPSEDWDDINPLGPCVVLIDTTYHIWYNNWTTLGSYQIGHATSSDGINWLKDNHNPVLSPGTSSGWDYDEVRNPKILYDGLKFHMWFTGGDWFHYDIGYAQSKDGSNWVKYNDYTTSSQYSMSDPVLTRGLTGSWDDRTVGSGSVMFNESGDSLKMWYWGAEQQIVSGIGSATAPLNKKVPDDYATIQAAIDAAQDGNVVLVDEGTYYENINFKGKAITVASQFYMDGDTSHISKTIIDGSQPSNPDSGSVVYFVSGEDTTSILYGFTITNGTGSEVQYTVQGVTYDARAGGGIICWNSGGRFVSNKIMNNTCSHDLDVLGGGVYAGDFGSDAHVILERNHIKNNKINGVYFAGGGGVMLSCNGKIVDNEIISYNSCTSTAYEANGGGIKVTTDPDILSRSRTVLIKGNTITHNFAEGKKVSPHHGAKGGGIVNHWCKVIILNNEILYNRLNAIDSGDAYGAGIHMNDANSGSFISSNTISYNSIAENITSGGGGINLRWCDIPVPIINNIISGNSALNGGGVDIYNSNSEIINNTIVKNTASSNGGGLYSTNPTPVVVNTIFWDNVAESDSQIYGSDDVLYSDIQGGWSGEGNTNAEPLFVDAANDDFHLLENSPGIGWGTDSLMVPKSDFYGNIRPHSIDIFVDMGAIESTFKQTPTAIDDMRKTIPFEFALNQNYPNPFNPRTIINYELPITNDVDLSIYNLLGQKMVNLVSEKQAAGHHQVEWDASRFSSGVYYYRIEAGEFQDVKKMILLR